jgi:hypothetical protein
MLFFKIVCFIWAAIGIVSRIAMSVMKEKWAVWEEKSAYKAERPAWVVVVSVFGFCMIAAAWLVYILAGVPYGWVLSALITLTAVKISSLLFNYSKFRAFLKETLASKQKMMRINVSVIILSAGLIALGIFLY